jgi:hypothetical protein
MLFEFSHVNAGFEALHFHGKPKQVKIRLPFALSKLSKQNIFQMIKRLIRIVVDINCVKNVPKDLLGQAGEGIGVLEFLRSDTCRGELCLDEAEPDVWLLLIVGKKFHLSCCSRRDRLKQIVLRHVGGNRESRQNPKG